MLGVCVAVQRLATMACKSSADDPMDLGPFLQNYVMKNPFTALQQQQQAATASLTAGARGPGGRPTAPPPPPRWSLRQRGRRGSSNNGAVVGSAASSTSADVSADRLLLDSDDASCHGDDVTAW